MCFRNAYHCKECNTTFGIPLKHDNKKNPLKWCLKLIFCCSTADDRQPLTDWLCDNKYCLRRTEEGYKLCLQLRDECWFCIRFGREHRCGYHLIYVPCRSCYYKSWTDPSDPRPYDVPLHYREVVDDDCQ